jgi:hypothetical protein
VPCRRAGLLILFLFFAARPGAAQFQGNSASDVHLPEDASVAQLVVANTALSGGFALLKAGLEGRIHRPVDALRVFAGGAASGYGFFQAKRLAGQGHIMSGLLLASASSSTARNVAEGNHPFGRMCVGLAVADACVATPLDRSGDPGLALEFNLLSFSIGAAMPLLGFRPMLSAGVLHYESDRSLGSEGNLIRGGLTIGKVILVGPHATDETRAHEAIHVIQAIQIGAGTPFLTAGSHQAGLRRDGAIGPVRIRLDMQVDWLYAVLAMGNLAMDYHRQWPEIEAHTLTRIQPGNSR